MGLDRRGGNIPPAVSLCCTPALLLSAFCSPWGLSWHGLPGAVSLGWDSGRVPRSCSSSPGFCAAGSRAQTGLS